MLSGGSDELKVAQNDFDPLARVEVVLGPPSVRPDPPDNMAASMLTTRWTRWTTCGPPA